MTHPFAAVRRTYYFMLLAAIMVGCTSAPRQAPEAAPEYVPDANYYLLMAEIAVQRKAWVVAAREYLAAAQLSADPELAQRATEFAYEYGFEAIALSAARRWLELGPGNPLANEYAGRLYLARNRLDRAFEHWSASLAESGLMRDDYLSVAADMAEQNNLTGATRLLSRLVNAQPDEPGLRMALAYAALGSGAPELALYSARRAAAAQPDWIQPALIIPRALMVLGREHEALAYLEDRGAEQPSLVMQIEAARLLSAVGRGDEAIRRLVDLGKAWGALPELVRVHGLIAFDGGDLEAARRDFEQLLASGSHVYESYFMLGRIALELGEYRRAIDRFERIRAGNFLVRAQLAISLARERLGDDAGALAQLRNFAEEFPRLAFDTAPGEAQLLYRMGRVDEALAVYERVNALQPDRVDMLLEYGAMLDLAGRHDAAIEQMRRALAVAPADSNALNTLGYTLTNRTRRHDEAYRLIRMALELEPDSAPIIDSMGWVLYHQGRLDEARSFLELALTKLEDPELIAHLGEVLWVGDERARALALWDRGLEKFPDSQPLIETRARFVR